MKFWVNSQHGIKDVFGELVVVPVFNGDFQGASPCDSSSFVECDSIMDGGIMRLARNEAFDGGKGSMLRYFADEAIAASQVMLLGLGDKDAISRDVLQDALAKMFKKVSALKLSEVTVDMRPLLHDSKFDAYALGEQLGYLATFLDHTVLHYKTKKGGHEGDHAISTLRALVPDVAHKGFREGMYAGRDIARGVNLARDLVETPAGDLTPTGMVAAAKKVIAASDGKISGNFFYPDKLKKMGAGALLGVAQGSKEPAVLIELDYTPSTGPTEEVLCLIGKTVTFDSGGLSLKTAVGMERMKYDMSGAAAVIGTMQVVGTLKPKVSVIGVIAATENMPGSKALHPGDVLQAMNGKTIEVNNTDAEGRLVLADALSYVCEEGVDEIIDLATLTGAIIHALGRVAAGVMGTSNELIKDLDKAAEEAGEKLWRLPLYEEFKPKLKSDIADLKNAGSGGEAGSCCAAMFLKEFVKPGIPWAHMDIAGVAWSDREAGEINKGGTGFGVRTLSRYILSR